MKVVISSINCRDKKCFFRPPEVSNDPMTNPFELGRLQRIPSEPPVSNSSEVTHIDASRPKFSVFFFSERVANRKTPVQGKIPIGIIFAQTQSPQHRGKFSLKLKVSSTGNIFRSYSQSLVQGQFRSNSKSPV